jgi:hypothetical protein
MIRAPVGEFESQGDAQTQRLPPTFGSALQAEVDVILPTILQNPSKLPRGRSSMIVMIVSVL